MHTKFGQSIVVFLLLLLSINALGQLSAMQKLSKPERTWVIKHPFVAAKTFRTTKNVLQIVKDKSLILALDTLAVGGKLDAFRHVFWMACVTKKIGVRRALLLGNAHEAANYLQFRNGKAEDGFLPDYASSKMDSLNNLIGTSIGNGWRVANKKIDALEIINYINNGSAYILKRNKNGQFVDCNNNEIMLNYTSKQWVNNKCVVLISDTFK